MNLTTPQRAALDVLAAAGAPVQGGRRSTRTDPLPYVNMRAAASLVRKGLARQHFPIRWSPYTHDARYSITDAGRAALNR